MTISTSSHSEGFACNYTVNGVRVQSRGHLLNWYSSTGSRIHDLLEQIPRLEKESRKTPAKTLVKEREKVDQAKVQLLKARAELVAVTSERELLRLLLSTLRVPPYG